VLLRLHNPPSRPASCCRYDGVSYVTQCPISPGTNFTYTIPIDDPPGTYFWHEHSSLLRADGLQASAGRNLRASNSLHK
jgi:FtsP/CotA-like multicopper oxidase with cupredoxin domain